jgi:hypothetical protein
MQLNWIWIELKFLNWIEILKLKWIKLNTICSSFGCNKVNVPIEISIELNSVELNHIKSNWIQIGWIQPNYGKKKGHMLICLFIVMQVGWLLCTTKLAPNTHDNIQENSRTNYKNPSSKQQQTMHVSLVCSLISKHER